MYVRPLIEWYYFRGTYILCKTFNIRYLENCCEMYDQSSSCICKMAHGIHIVLMIILIMMNIYLVYIYLNICITPARLLDCSMNGAWPYCSNNADISGKRPTYTISWVLCVLAAKVQGYSQYFAWSFTFFGRYPVMMSILSYIPCRQLMRTTACACLPGRYHQSRAHKTARVNTPYVSPIPSTRRQHTQLFPG